MEVLGNYSIEIKEGKTGLTVPVVNSIHLHSVYDPIKEAEQLLDKYTDAIGTKNNVLILGLGFGYHVKEAIFRLKKNFQDNYKVIVIEPNKELYDAYVENAFIQDDNLEIVVSDDINAIYTNPTVVDILIEKPVVIAHPASFNLYKEFFKNYLTYKASDYLRDITPYINSHTLTDYLTNYDRNLRTDEVAYELKNRKATLTNRNDFLMLALDRMTSMGLKQESTGNE